MVEHAVLIAIWDMLTTGAFYDDPGGDFYDARGFTLIELLAVIAILVVLVAIVVFSVRGTSNKGEAAAAATDLQNIRTAEEAFWEQVGHYGSERTW